MGFFKHSLTVRGRVQGVGYRYFVLETAESRGLTGWVANADDGSVRIVAVGDRDSLERFRESLSEGPPLARVDSVNYREETVDRNEYPSFEIAGGEIYGE